jgi:hypothetical protein
MVPDDVPAVVRMLRAEFLRHLPEERVTRILALDFGVPRPNIGYLIEAGGRPVGCLAATYSERTIDGRVERVVNANTWYVEPEYRKSSMLLPRALFGQPGYTFTTLTPNNVTQAVFPRFGFKPLEREFRLYLPGRRAPETPVGLLGSRARVASSARALERELAPPDRRILDDHRPFPCGHFLLTAKGHAGYSYVVTRRRTLQRYGGWIPVSEVLYVSDPALAARHFERLKVAIALRDRSLAVASDPRHLGPEPPSGRAVPRPRLFKSETLRADQVDSLYSEIVLL